MNSFVRIESGELVPHEEPNPAMTRRDVIANGSRLAFGVWAGLAFGHRLVPRLGLAADGGWEVRGYLREVTPTAEFYTVDINFRKPQVAPDEWSLQVDGHVHRQLQLDYDTLTQDTPTTRAYVTLTCISNEVGGHLAGNALWRGIRLRDLLQQAGVREGAVDVVGEAHDGYTDSIPIGKAMDPDTLVVWEMNGAPLTASHGAPVRLIVPGIYGMKSVKWLRRLTVVDHDFKGYWATRGWDDVAVVNTWSRIDLPRERRFSVGEAVRMGGVAFAGDRGISEVEFSVDRGQTWRPVVVKEPLGPVAWQLWQATWHPESAGRGQIIIRATDGLGRVQSPVRASTYPNGASGYHALAFDVNA